MKQPYYGFSVDNECVRYNFLSAGKKLIRKQIQFDYMEHPQLYNLALGDLDVFGEFDSYSKSNNGDMEKVLATTIQIIIHFFITNPEAIVYLAGNTPSRTRLYQIIIGREFESLSEQFRVFGKTANDFEEFRLGVAYDGFAIIPKKY